MVKFKSLIYLVFFTILSNLVFSQNIYTDKINQKIWEAKDRNDVVYTKQILQSGNASQKLLALNGLQSWHDAELRKPLLRLVKKGKLSLKIAALQAIGQSHDSFYVPYLLKLINHKRKQNIKADALTALGKCITPSKSSLLLQIENTSQAGYAECMYRAMLNKVVDKKLMDNMCQLLLKGNKENTFYASWYLARSPFPLTSDNIKPVFTLLYETANISTDVSIPLILSLAKAKVNPADSLKIRLILNSYVINERKLSPEQASLNQIAAYRAMFNGKYLLDSLSFDLSTNFSSPALEVTISELIAKNCKAFLSYPQLKYSPAVVNFNKISDCTVQKSSLPATGTLYDKIWNLQLQENNYQYYSSIKNVLIQASDPAIKGAATESLIKCRNAKGFPNSLINDFAEIMAILIKDADPGVLSIIANAMLDKQLNIDSDYDPATWKELLNEAKTGLTLPRDMEALIDIEKVLAKLNNTTFVKPETEWNNPIDWAHVSKIAQNQKVKVTTNKGEFIIQFSVNEAPASVSAILKLVESGYYNGKSFHRLVPNFVIQGGCPRGDGFGSMNYTLRSEFSSLKYSPGAVGLASAGPNTESCQWFVTHCPTPHLDGRYTIIGYVVKGMEVIQKLGVGDKMLTVERL
jgi:cyclophilin family peptidyl-prolyl cis-trans isomerase